MENIIVSLGEANILNRLKDNSQGPIIGMGVGTSGTAPAKGNTSLTNEVRKAIETATVNTTAKTTTFKTTFTAAEINRKSDYSPCHRRAGTDDHTEHIQQYKYPCRE